MLARASFELAALDWRVHLVWLVVVLGLMAARAGWLRRRALMRYGLPAPAGVALRRRWRATLTLGALLLLLFALLQPRTDPVVKSVRTKVRDLVVCFNVSRSMLADDLLPNRLERAKLELSRLADAMEGDRLGLVIFAGDAVAKCPLTPNTSYFKSTLRGIGPRSASQGGTRIGDAVRKALGDVLGLELTGTSPTGDDPETPAPAPAPGPEAPGRFADILLITDGEDHDSYPVYAARSARALDVGIYAIGLGSADGHTIPLEDGSGILMRDGAPVLSKLDTRTLLEMVQTAGRGRMLPVGTNNFDLVGFWREHIRDQPGRQLFEERMVWTEIFQPFGLAGIAMLLLAWSIPLTPRGTRHDEGARGTGRSDAAPARPAARTPQTAGAGATAGAAALLLAATLLVSAGAARADTDVPESDATEPEAPHLVYNAGVQHLGAGEWERAIEKLERASLRGTDTVRQRASFNLGVAWHALGDAHLEDASGEPSAPTTGAAPPPGSEADQDEDPRKDALRQAIQAYTNATGVYRRVRPRTDDEVRALTAVKLRLRQAVEALQRLEDEERARQEEALLNDPPRLLAKVTEAERARRRALATLADAPLRTRRVPARRARQATAEDRALLERLRAALEAQAEGAAGDSQGQEPPPGDPGAEQRARALAAITAAAAGMEQEERLLHRAAIAETVAQYGRTIEALLAARLAFPTDPGQLIGELEREQELVLARTRSERALAREQEEIALLLGALAQATPPTATASLEASDTGGAPQGEQALSPEILAGLRDLATQGVTAANAAARLLDESAFGEAVPAEEHVLSLLEEMRELLPVPLPERLRRVLEAERTASGELEDPPDDAQALASLIADLLERQQVQRGEAERIAGELEQLAQGGAPGGASAPQAAAGPDPERMRQAAEEVQAGTMEIGASQDALTRTLPSAAREAVDRAVEHLVKALELLKPEQQQQQGDQQQEQQQQQDQQDQQDQDQQDESMRDARRMSAREARQRMEEMDRERRELEEQMHRGVGGPAVDKDW